MSTEGLSQATDDALVRAVAGGLRGALAEVYERHGAPTGVLARRLCGDDLADDVVQDVFLRLWKSPGSFDPDRGSLRSYLLMLTRSRAIDLLRSGTTRRNREHVVQSTHTRRMGVDPPDGVDGRDVRGTDALLSQLSSPQREAVFLAYYVGYSYREVAQVLGQPEGTIKSRIRAGLAHLHDLLGQDQWPPGPARGPAES
jgi:RNA polymerase sigma factor (sigma-70 family)